MFKRILLAIDDSPSGSAAVSFAVAMAKDSGARPRAPRQRIARRRSGPHRGDPQGGRPRARHGGGRAPRRRGDGHRSDPHHQLLQRGAVASPTPLQDWSADVIVVGSRRRHRLGGLAGQVGMRERITGLTTLPVMTAPPPLRVDQPRPHEPRACGRARSPAAHPGRLLSARSQDLSAP